MIDIGTSSVRAGYAGDDTPKAIIPTHYGFMPSADAESTDVPMGDEQPAPAPKPKAHMYVGQHGPTLWREGMEVGTPITGSLSTPPIARHPCAS